MKLYAELIFIWKVSHLNSFGNRGTRELGNGLLIRSYLINRKQRVKIENAYSNWRVVQRGFPQGSLLGPLLFNIYINDITYVTKNMELRLYADDTTGYAASNSPATLEFYINSDLVRLSQWLEDSYLTINTTKTQAMIVGKSNYNYELFLKSNNILTIDELKLLGVTIDNKLTFSSHIKLVLQIFFLQSVQK